MPRRPLLALLVAAAVAGCGDDETVSAPTPEPEATAVVTEEPTPEPTPTDTPSPTPTEQPSPEEQEGGAGDEEEARVRAFFSVDRKGVTPPQISVPAFFVIELFVQNGYPAPMTVTLVGAKSFEVGAYNTRRVRLEGLRPGRYTIDFGRGQKGLLITGAEPGP